MNREIRFRGIRIDNGEFVYGYFNTIQNKEHYITEQCVLGLIHREVVPKTVSQFTGCYDNNGNDIYEGDIVKDDATTFEIKWYKGRFDFYRIKGCYQNPYFGDNCSRMKIIGNIYQNADILTTEA